MGEAITDDEKEIQKLVTQLINGKIEPANDTIAYFVDQAKNKHAELNAARANVEELKRQLTQWNLTVVELEALRGNYTKDLEFWLRKEQDAAEPEPKESNDRCDETPPGSDQHGDEGPGAPEEVAA